MEQNGDGNEMEARLLETIRNRLTENGGLIKIKSELRAMVINDVREGDNSSLNFLDTKDAISPTQIANQLVLEYLEWIGFQYSLNMFATESGCAKREHNINIDESKLGIKVGRSNKELPLLMALTINLMKENEKNLNKD